MIKMKQLIAAILAVILIMQPVYVHASSSASDLEQIQNQIVKLRQEKQKTKNKIVILKKKMKKKQSEIQSMNDAYKDKESYIEEKEPVLVSLLNKNENINIKTVVTVKPDYSFAAYGAEYPTSWMLKKNIANTEPDLLFEQLQISKMQSEYDDLQKQMEEQKARLRTINKKINKLKSRLSALKKKLTFQGIALQYSKPYNITKNHLTKSKGIMYYNGRKETYYSQKVLPGGGLSIPGRHVAQDGTIRDKDGYIVVSAAKTFLAKHERIMTSLGPAKVYDTGCKHGVVDIYVNW